MRALGDRAEEMAMARARWTMTALLDGVGPMAVADLTPAWAGARGAVVAPPRPAPRWASRGLATVVAAAVLAGAVAVSAVRLLDAAPAPVTTPELGAGTMPVGLGPVAAAALAPAAYHLAADGQGWTAGNPAQGLEVAFAADVVQFTAATGGAELGLELAAIGRSGALAAPEAARLEAAGARIEYQRGSLTEWYVNDARGVEQGFTLDARPVGAASVPVVVELAPSGGFTPVLDASGDAVRLVGDGATFSYRGLHAYDAAARPLAAELGVSEGRITLTVDDAGAAYPVTIDPIVTVEEAHLHHPDAAPGDALGSSVAVWGDTAVVGAPSTPGGGAAYVFTNNGGSWTLQATLVGSTTGPGDELGRSVAISGPTPTSADTVVVGAPGDTENASAGLAYVFTRSGGTWSEQAVLFDPTGSPLDRFGASVGVSGDLAVVGSPDDRINSADGAGSASTFVRSGSSWAFDGRLLGDGDILDRFGTSVAISGTTAVVGAPTDTANLLQNDAGTVSVFVRDGTWQAQAQKLAHAGFVANEQAGQTVAISGDRIVVGVPNALDGRPAAVVWQRTGTSWSEQAGLRPPSRNFGASAVSIAGDKIVIGNDRGGGGALARRGRAHLYTWDGSAWAHQAELQQSEADDSTGDDLGAAVAVTGEAIVVGVPFDDTTAGADAGSAYVFRTVREAPSVSIGRHPSQATPSGASPLRFRATFSEAVTGFAADDVLVLGTAGGTAAIDLADSDPAAGIYTIGVSGMTQDGSVIVHVRNGAAVDSAGIPTLPSGSAVIFYDATPPTAALTKGAEQEDPTSDATIAFTVTFSERVWGLYPVDVSLEADGTGAVTTVQSVTPRLDDELVWDIVVTGMTETGDVTVSVPAGAALDDAGNGNLASSSATVHWVDSQTPPTVDAGPGGSTTEGASVPLDGTVSDPEGDPITARWTIEGSPAHLPLDPGAACVVADPTAVDTTVTCDDDVAQLRLRLTADDGSNPPVSDVVDVTFTNVAPTLGALAGADGPKAVGTEVVLSIPFTDPGANDGHRCLVTWADGDAPAAEGTVSDGTCTAAHTYAGRGTYLVRVYLEDDDGGWDDTDHFPLSVGVAPQTIDFTHPGDRTWGDAPFTVSATASSGLPVGYGVAPGDPCTVAGDVVTITGTGTCRISASQGGDATYLPAPNVVRFVTIAQAPQTIDFPVLPPRTVDDEPFTIGATATSGLPVTFSRVGGGCTVSGATVTITAGGVCTIAAAQAGDDHFLPAPPVVRAFDVARRTQTIDFPHPGARGIGDVFTVSATATSGLPVTFSAGPADVCTAAGATVTIVDQGTCAVTASQAGDGLWDPASATHELIIGPRTSQTITFEPPDFLVYGSAPHTLSATATSGLPVSFSVPAGGPCTLSGSTLTITRAGGDCVVTADQAGSPAWFPAPAVTERIAAARAPLVIHAAPATMTYGDGGVANAPASYAGFVGGDDASVLTAAPTCGGGTPTTPAGTHASGVTCSGAVAANYSITYAPAALTVTPALLTVTASDETTTYGRPVDVDPSYSGFRNGEGASVLTTAPSCASGPLTTPVGEHASTTSCSGAAAANYDLTYVDGTLTVTPAPLTVTAADAVKTYGAEAPPVTATYGGFVNDEGPSVLSTAPTCAADTAPTAPVGGYPGATSCAGGAATNYAIGYVDGDLTVTPAALTVTASDASMVYGGSRAVAAPSYAGFVNGEDATQLTTAPTCGGGSSTTPVGTYAGATSCSGATAANYEIDYVDGALTVTRAPLTITASDASMIYGAGAPTVAPSYDGFVNAEDASDLATAPTCGGGSSTTPAGTYPGATSCSGAAAANYDITYVSGDLTVDRAQLTVTASDASMTYGGAAPVVTPSYEGFVNGEDPTVLTTAPTCGGGSPTTPAGTHATSCSGATAANYDVEHEGGTLTVAKATLVVTADPKAKAYLQPVPPLTATITGFVNGEGPSVVSGSPALSTTASATSNVGTHPITVGLGTLAASNYRFDLVDGLLVITPATTALAARPAVLEVLPLGVRLGVVEARLTSGGAPVAGQTIVFRAGTTKLCTATTDADGTAACGTTLAGAVAALLNLGYTADFAGTPNLVASSAKGALIRI